MRNALLAMDTFLFDTMAPVFLITYFMPFVWPLNNTSYPNSPGRMKGMSKMPPIRSCFTCPVVGSNHPTLRSRANNSTSMRRLPTDALVMLFGDVFLLFINVYLLVTHGPVFVNETPKNFFNFELSFCMRSFITLLYLKAS